MDSTRSYFRDPQENQANAEAFIRYLSSDAAQAIYEKHGFLRATADELSMKDIPIK